MMVSRVLNAVSMIGIAPKGLCVSTVGRNTHLIGDPLNRSYDLECR